jgi:hypothetical protein
MVARNDNIKMAFNTKNTAINENKIGKVSHA